MSEKDLTGLWEEDGDLERMKVFFRRFDVDSSKKESIKQLTLAKLAHADSHTASGQRYNVDPELELNASRNKNSETWKKRLSTIGLGWGLKLAIPAAVIVLLAIVGQPVQDSRLSGQRAGSSPQRSFQDSLLAPQEALGGGMQADKAKTSDVASKSTAIKPPLPVPEAPPADAALPRKMTQNLSVVLQVDNVRAAIDKITQQVKSAGGYVVESQQNASGNSASGQITVKIPAAKLDGLQSSLPSWGKVLDQHLTANDITNQYYDAQTRLEAWESEQKRYLEILQQAKSVDDILRIEGALANIRQQIEQLKGQLKLWNNQVDFSTVQLQLQTQPGPDIQINNPWHPVSWSNTWTATKNAVLKTVSSTWNAANYVVVGVGYAFPYLLVAALGWFGYRFWKKKKTS